MVVVLPFIEQKMANTKNHNNDDAENEDHGLISIISGGEGGNGGGGGGGGSGSAPEAEEVALKKGPWTAAEDAVLMDYVTKHGEGNWNAVQKNTGLARCGKSCRLRWTNHLRPNLKKGAFSPDEEKLILELHAQYGNKWARMAALVSIFFAALCLSYFLLCFVLHLGLILIPLHFQIEDLFTSLLSIGSDKHEM